MGATSGIGMEVAKLLAAKGWQVGIAGRRIERLQTLVSDNKTTLQSAEPSLITKQRHKAESSVISKSM